MVTLQREIMSRTIELSKEAFGTFCDDISTMFGPKMQYIPQNVCYENIDALKARFSKLVAVFFVKAEGAEGALEGTFQLIFDRGGLFTLAGLTIMPQQMTSLLERIVGPQNIMDNIKSGTLKEAEEMGDALAEVGNMLIGAWDRVFRERLKGHKHFVQANVFIGNPWDKPEEKTGLASGTKTAFFPFKMKVDGYPPFYCGVIFPQKIFGDLSETELKAWAEGEAKTKAEAETRAEAEAKAKAEAEAKTETEAEANIEAEKSKAEAEKVKAEAEKVKAEAEKVKAEAEKAKAEAEKVKAETEAKVKTEAEAEAKTKAKAKANMEAEKAKAEAERAKVEAEKAKAEAEKAKAEAEKAKAEAEKAKLEAATKTKTGKTE
jgi:hypothetical protein